MLGQTVINTVIQIILFSAIPILWWFFSARKKENLLSWIGLTTPKFRSNKKAFIILFITFVPLLAIGLYLTFMVEDKSQLAGAAFADLGIAGVVPLLVYAVFQTGLSEEVLFRGFLCKRLSGKFGFTTGNTIQAALFGVVHGVLLFGIIGTTLTIAVIMFTAIVGWLMGFLNEKLGNGSIVPSWIVHALANLVPASLFLFGI
jgi:membrane protease YdiL (CAAX protease family)